jgi:hypothetical protein
MLGGGGGGRGRGRGEGGGKTNCCQTCSSEGIYRISTSLRNVLGGGLYNVPRPSVQRAAKMIIFKLSNGTHEKNCLIPYLGAVEGLFVVIYSVLSFFYEYILIQGCTLYNVRIGYCLLACFVMHSVTKQYISSVI